MKKNFIMEMLEEIAQETVKEIMSEKIEVSRISLEMLTKYREFRNSSIAKAKELEIQRTKLQLYTMECGLELEKMHDIMWGDIYAETGISPAGRYNIDLDTGIIYEDKIAENPFARR
jgi:hypothetical protein